MKKLFALLLGLTLAGPALADRIYYVRSDGHDTASGAGNTNNASTGAWRTIANADTVTAVTSNTTVIVYTMSPADTGTAATTKWAPANAGAGFSKMITLRFVHASPDSMVVWPISDIALKNYCRIVGFRIGSTTDSTTSIGGIGGTGESVDSCAVNTATWSFWNAHNGKIAHSRIVITGVGTSLDGVFDFGGSLDPDTSSSCIAAHCQYDTLRANAIQIRNLGDANGGKRGIGFMNGTMYCRVDSNRTEFRWWPDGSGDPSGSENLSLYFRESLGDTLEYNRWIYEAGDASHYHGTKALAIQPLIYRSGTIFNYCHSDTFDVGFYEVTSSGWSWGTHLSRVSAAKTSGSWICLYGETSDRGAPSQTKYLTMRGCVARGLGYWEFQESTRGDTLENNIVAMSGSGQPALWGFATTSSPECDSCYVVHNTFYAPSGVGFGFDFDSNTAHIFGAHSYVSSNIFFGGTTGTCGRNQAGFYAQDTTGAHIGKNLVWMSNNTSGTPYAVNMWTSNGYSCNDGRTIASRTQNPTFVNGTIGPSLDLTPKLGADAYYVGSYVGAIAFASPPSNNVFYVDGGLGNDAWDGTSAHPWRTLAKANASLPAPSTDYGDVILYIAPGLYNDPIAPVAVPGNGKRFYFIAKSITSPPTVAVNIGGGGGQMALVGTYETLRGISFSGLSIGSTAVADTIAQCDIAGNLTIAPGAYYQTIVKSNVYGTTVKIAVPDDATAAASTSLLKTVKLSIYDSSFPYLAETATDPGFRMGYATTTGNAYRALCDSALIRNCTFRGTSPQGSSGLGLFRLRYTCNSTWEGNKLFPVQNDISSASTVWLSVRDSSINLIMRRDTVLAGGSGQQTMYMSGMGAVNTSVTKSTIDSCYFSNTNGPLFVYQDGMSADSLVYSTFIAPQDRALWVWSRAVGRNAIKHCTFVSRLEPSVVPKGVVDFSTGSPIFSSDSTIFQSNIIYNAWPREYHPLGTTANSNQTMVGGVIANCCASGSKAETWLKSEYNLYSVWTYSDSSGSRWSDHSFLWFDSGKYGAAPGPVNARMPSWDTRMAADSLSVWGSAQFNYGAASNDTMPGIGTFDPHIGPNSAGKGNALGGTDAGALAVAGSATALIYDYGAIQIDSRYSTSRDSIFTVKNTGTAELDVTITITGSGFTSNMVLSPLTMALAAGERLPVSMAWTGLGNTGFAGKLYINLATNDPGRPKIKIPVLFTTSSSSGGWGIEE
jgi:hypothetical protein